MTWIYFMRMQATQGFLEGKFMDRTLALPSLAPLASGGPRIKGGTIQVARFLTEETTRFHPFGPE